MIQGKVAVIEDTLLTRTVILDRLKELECEAEGFASFEEFLASPVMAMADLVLMDIELPGISGLEALQRIRARHEGLPVIIITGHGTVERAVEALKAGAFDFFTKPIDFTKLGVAIKNAMRQYRLVREISGMKTRYERSRMGGLVGGSAGMQTVYRIIENVAKSSATVLITGESGTGKELVALAIHQHSDRARGPFVPLNCAAIPKELLESELFGHERGAFTGATGRKTGCCERAHGGTLLLDEICDMEFGLQAKLLRFLQQRAFMRVGGERMVEVNTRVIAATNKAPIEEVGRGTLREDLYYRINVVPIHIPPLRERTEDIPAIVAHLLDAINRKSGKGFQRVSAGAMAKLASYPWPGNVREIENALERIVVLNDGTEITEAMLPEGIAEASRGKAEFGDLFVKDEIMPLAVVERDAVMRAVEHCGGDPTAAARRLGIGQATIYRKLKQYGWRK